MTTLAAWMSRDSAGKRTLYLGSDSKGSDVEDATVYTHNIKKVFASEVSPEIFAFSGEIQEGQDLLRRVCTGGLTQPLGTFARAEEITQHPVAKNGSKHTLDILYGVRTDTESVSEFTVFRLERQKERWTISKFSESNLLAGDGAIFIRTVGTGAENFRAWRRRIMEARHGPGPVSRINFWALCDLIEDGTDERTGGGPQLGKIDGSGSGNLVGIYYRGKPRISGTISTQKAEQRKHDWVDDNFTWLNPETLKPWSKGQVYTRIRVLPADIGKEDINGEA